MRLSSNASRAWLCGALSSALLLTTACGEADSTGGGEDGDPSSDGKGDGDGVSMDGDGDVVDPSIVDFNDPERCVSNREFFATRAWPQVVGKVCLQCHGPGGTADQQGSSYELQPAAFPGFLDVNLENLAAIAEREVGGTSVLLLTPTGQLEHGGGAVILEDSDEYRVLGELVQRLSQDEEECPQEARVAVFDDVDMLGPVASFRKAALQLNGRLPTPAETETLLEQGESALPDAIRGLFTEEAFYDRLIEMFNDQWLTDRYLRDGNNVLRSSDFPNLETYYDGLSDLDRERARRSIAREPLELMAYIVRNDRPFTEIVTADFTVLNPFTAPIYNNDSMSFQNYYDEKEFQTGQIRILRQDSEDQPRTELKWPHAGILSSPIWLNRYPTSPTNRNRHRARIVLRELLATDILAIADRPIDPTSAVNFANPTREDPACKTCHTVIDPIAGAFQKWDDNRQAEYEPDREWHTEMYLPGFGQEQMQVNDYPQALAWLGQRIAADPRFPLAVVQNAYKSLTGQAPLEFPTEPGDAASYLAWEAQDATVRAIASAFAESGFNYKTVIEKIVMSPYYRARNTTASSEGRLSQLSAVGTGQLLTPELLNRKLEAVLGHSWMQGNGNPMLLGDLRILYGGIDSESVTERLTTPNGLMSAIIWRMSTEVACFSVARDFAKPQAERRLFRMVEADTVPEDDLAELDEAAVAAINENLEYLYALFLGEGLQRDSAEHQRVFDLFINTWREGRAKLADDRVAQNLPYACQYRRELGADEDLPEDQRLTQDPRYVMRSWMAVISYLLSDYKFTHE